ncbi:diguanylate cyclase domain-containing protein [Aurantimonas endophytica]|uniref:Diguanylate cyclase (GGDEF)-like protein n=1 Tax=Aurantimonas endophytica TaxID=1522175 RepID=A0A7W6MPX6_9HYPH|nr:diguanylate cyclase (GGDEF)-like protein [Aurantimonas endophytica]MCO6404208.1 diguanylate cyclase [Aurantimonas endophytica]
MNQAASVSREDGASLAALRRKVAAQEALIRRQAASLARSRKIFERASAAARIGVWECNLADESLTWTDVVYDIFDLPRGTPPKRALTLECYPPQSRQLLETMRSRAIAERGGFNLDTEIITKAGRRRWIRITATVESENGRPVRIFGMKQDITEEKLLLDQTRYLAEFDVMTGLANRSRFQAALATLAEGDTGALLLVDLDGFKAINDNFGHAIGDDCLKAVAARLEGLGANADLVARIGGDEFALLLGLDFTDHAIGALAEAIVGSLGRPIECGDRMMAIGASIGIARTRGCNASELFIRADMALYAAKASGRNTYRMFEPTMVERRSTRAA